MTLRSRLVILWLAQSFLLLYAQTQAATTGEAHVKLRVMETSDIHSWLLPFNYFLDKPSQTYGLIALAEDIRAARSEVANSVLVDNGDLIQGTPLADYVARIRGLKEGETHPCFRVMNQLNYDVGNVGNHEFNYGLPFLKQALATAAFPYICANVYLDKGDGSPGDPLFSQYLIKRITVRDDLEQEYPLKVGFIGFVPPQIMQWDRTNLAGKVVVRDTIEVARELVPKMKAEGADVVVAIPHSGLGLPPQKKLAENNVLYLSRVPDIDAILFGHRHLVFPSEQYKDYHEDVNWEQGLVAGVPAVMPGCYGSHLGIIDLDLKKSDSGWEVIGRRVEARPRSAQPKQGKNPLEETVAQLHRDTLAWIRQPIGNTQFTMANFFAAAADDPTLQLINQAQINYGENILQGTEYDGIPVLGAASPFKYGFGGSQNYIVLEKGELSIKDIANLYSYPNLIALVLVDGKLVREWLEMSTIIFNRIDPADPNPQSLIADDALMYNFDCIDGVSYRIDLTKPAKYDRLGKQISDGGRIQDLRFKDEPIQDHARFIIATNNYRAEGGGHFPGMDGSRTIVLAPDENRQVIVNYVLAKRSLAIKPDFNWSLRPLPKGVDVRLKTSASPMAQKLAAELYPHLQLLEEDERGYGLYRIVVH